MSAVTTKQKKVPDLRFAGFSGEWGLFPLKNLCIRIGDGIHSTPVYDVNGEYFFVNGNNLVEGQVVISDTTKRLNAKEANIHHREIDSHTLLLSINGTVGNVAKYKGEKIILGKSACYIKLNDDVKLDLIYYLIQTNSIQRFYSSEMTGSTIKNLSLKSVSMTPIYLSNITEQKKVADFLISVDSLLDNLRAQKQTLETYKKGMIQKLFSQRIRFKDENGKSYPEWNEKKLGEVAVKSNTGLTANVLDGNGGDFKVYGATGELKRISFFEEQEPYIAIIKDGAGVGRSFICDGKSSVLGTLNVIKPINQVDLYFLHMLIKNLRLTKYIVGGTIPHIYYKDYKREKVSVPSLLEQQRIAKFLTSLDDKISAKAGQIAKVAEWKKGLMQKMFI